VMSIFEYCRKSYLSIAIRAGFMKNLKYCRVGSAYRILPTTSGFCVRTALRKRAVQKSAQESYSTTQCNLTTPSGTNTVRLRRLSVMPSLKSWLFRRIFPLFQGYYFLGVADSKYEFS